MSERKLRHSCYVSEQGAFLGPRTLNDAEFIEKFLCMLEAGLASLAEVLRATSQSMENPVES